ncbi:hypothetical protein METHP14_10338 [Pseudomonas sp. P14-2025]
MSSFFHHLRMYRPTLGYEGLNVYSPLSNATF